MGFLSRANVFAWTRFAHGAFAELGAAKIIGQVLPHNIASLKLHEKLGFFRLPEQNDVAQFELSLDKCYIKKQFHSRFKIE